MKNYAIPPQISIREIELTIRDLDRSIDFYTTDIGLRLRARNNGQADLGTETTTLVRLFENPDARPTRGTTGLYHFAILVPERKNLAGALKRMIQMQTPVQGFADHGVSEAIYLSDPDGNGIEIYRDCPRQEWPIANGELQMVTDPLNLEKLLSVLNGDHGEHDALPADTTIGHMHLHVRDIPEAVNFYRDVLGFNLRQRYGPSAAFLAAGDYHHHIGVNTWAGVSAPPPPEGSAGLQQFTINLSSADDLESLKNHIQLTKTKIRLSDTGFAVQDPSGNRIQLSLTK